MIIKELRIKNFRSYYGDNNLFQFSEGLTLIIGDGGDGKTTFFEALQWLLNTVADKGSMDHLSEMRKSQMEPGDRDEVAVSLKFEHYGEKSVEKAFTVEKLESGGFKIGPVVYRGYETNGSEREAVNGKALIERCYDAFIQKFSMFKGESELNVFENKSAVKDLVDKFSDIRKFDELVKLTANFEEKSKKAYHQEMRNDTKVSSRTKELESSITRLNSEIATTRRDIREMEDSISIYSQRLNELEDTQQASERYQDIKNRLKTQEERRTTLQGNIMSVNYNHALLDKMWILAPFTPILKAFQEKVSAISKAKRQLDKDFERAKAIELGKLEAAKEMLGALANGATELPWYLPNQETMEDMIHDHICKVCGREAPEGSDAYAFMVHKLEEYRRHTEAKLIEDAKKKEIESQGLFPHNQIEQLHNLSVSLSGPQEAAVAGYAQEIADRQALVVRYQGELKQVKKNIQDLIDEKTRLLIQAGNISESVLEKDYNDIRGLYSSHERASVRLSELETELKYQEKRMAELKKELDELDPESSQVKVKKEVYRAFEEIALAFAQAKRNNLRRFLAEMEAKANEYMDCLSANDFHGQIRLLQTADNSTEIKLMSSNDSEVKNPSGSQKTVMYISVLFAISDFTQQKRDEDYPLIFDAATSSFGEAKEEDFYNVINKIQKQCVIATKDFIKQGRLNEAAIDGLNCSVYRIKKAPNFDKSNMATVRTLIEKIR